MAEFTTTSQQGGNNFKEAVVIDVNRVYDTCRDQDCLEDLRVFCCDADYALIDRAVDCRCKSCEVVWVYLDTEQVGFNKGCYLVKTKFFFKCVFDLYLGSRNPTEITGMATYEKKCILYGSESNTRSFTSESIPGECWNSPANSTTGGNSLLANIELVEPVVLGCNLIERCSLKQCDVEFDPGQTPPFVTSCFGAPLCERVECEKRLVVSIGIFSVVKLMRKVQMLVPAYEFSLPEKRSVDYIEDEPCNIFKNISFPTEQFYPPAKSGNECSGM